MISVRSMPRSRRVVQTMLAAMALLLAHALRSGPALAETGDIAVGGVWVCRLTKGTAGLTLEQRIRQVEQRITNVLSMPELQRRKLAGEVQPVSEGAAIVVADITIITVTPEDAAGTNVPVQEVANQWAGRLVKGLRHALLGREIVGVMYTQPRGSNPAEAGRLTGMTWYWRGTLMNDGTQILPADPRRCTLQFLADGRIAVQADCNRGLVRTSSEAKQSRSLVSP